MRSPFFSWMLLVGLLGAPSLAAATPADWSALQLVGTDGKALDEARVDGHVVLFVNVASFCSYTVQYASLEALWQKYKDQGLLVVGVPCNQFGAQEPGSDKEIQNFCSTRYGVTFPLLQKQEVNGTARSPLYKWLVASKPGANRDVGWNFEKFLIDRRGEVIGRFPSHVEPQDPQLTAAIEMALAAPG